MSNSKLVKKSLPDALARISDSKAMRQNAKKWSSDKNKNVKASKAANSKSLSDLWGLTEAYINEELGEQSEHTYLNYYSALKQFLLYADAEGINLLKPEGAVKSYIRDLESYGLTMFTKDETGELILAAQTEEGSDNQQGLARSSVGVKVAALRTLYAALRWSLDKEDAERLYPLLEMKLKKDTKKAHQKRQPYQDETVEKLLETAEDSQDKALLYMLAHAGLRIAEAVSLKWGAINWEAHTIGLIGKGNKFREVTLSKRAEAALWTLKGETLGSSNSNVFTFRTPHAARYRIKKLCKAASIDYLGAHSFRHTALTRKYRETKDLKAVAEVAGHAPSSIATTSVYAHHGSEDTHEHMRDW